MTQSVIRSGGSPRAEKPRELVELPDNAAAAEADNAADAEADNAADAEAGNAAAAEADNAADAADAEADNAADDQGPFEDEEPERAERPKLPLSKRLRRTPPALVILTIAAVGSWGFLAWQLASRTAPISLLTASAFVTGLVYVAVMLVCTIATYRAGYEGRTGRAFLLAFIGGISAIVAALSFAGALVLFLTLGF
jgi:hypothetical protein